MTMQVIRGGRVLDAGGHSAEPGDILVDGDTIREIGPPGMPAPEAVEIDAAAQDEISKQLRFDFNPRSISTNPG